MSPQKSSIAGESQALPTLLTATWSADLAHFTLMRASVERSALAGLRHRVLVQTEDLPLFKGFASSTVELLATAEVLPAEVESRRVAARRLIERLGRGANRLARSLHKRSGRPWFVPYAGWQVQQLTKLAAAASLAGEGPAVVLDSDVVVTAHARLADLQGTPPICFERWEPQAQVRSKRRAWHEQAHRLLKLPVPAAAFIDTYFETPFIFQPPAVRALLAHVERLHDRPWHQAFIDQPVRQWSEFGTYRVYLRHHWQEGGIRWQPDRLTRFIFDADDPACVKKRFLELGQDASCGYIVIHSEQSDRRRWSAEAYAAHLLPLL